MPKTLLYNIPRGAYRDVEEARKQIDTVFSFRWPTAEVYVRVIEITSPDDLIGASMVDRDGNSLEVDERIADSLGSKILYRFLKGPLN